MNYEFCPKCKQDIECDLCGAVICEDCSYSGKVPFDVICFNCFHIIDDVVPDMD